LQNVRVTPSDELYVEGIARVKLKPAIEQTAQATLSAPAARLHDTQWQIPVAIGVFVIS
jgi:hypothetical protein